MSRRRKLLFGLLFAAAVLGLLELGAALVTPEPRGSLVVSPDRCYFGWAPDTHEEEQKPGLRHVVRTDAEGFRAGNPPREARCDVLALGDSFTEGLFVQGTEAWPAALERDLRALGYDVRVHNGGMRGHTIVHERIAALGRWRAMEPEVVLVQHTANDLADLSVAPDTCPPPEQTPEAFGAGIPPFVLRTNLGRLFQEAAVRVRPRQPPSQLTPDACRASVDRYAAELEALAAGVAAWGGRTVMVELSSFFCAGAGDDFTRLRGRLRAAVGPGGYADLRDVLDAEGSTLAPLDTHPSAFGYTRVAERLARVLADGDHLARCR